MRVRTLRVVWGLVAPAVLLFASVVYGQNFIRGDFNCDGVVDGRDFDDLLSFIDTGMPVPPCMKAADVNGNGLAAEVADVIFLQNFLSGGPPAPYPECGTDESAIRCDVSCGQPQLPCHQATCQARLASPLCR
ncbi:MAG TPA: dockerin type I repeat-containing protein [candidate division Zixibacteria bacterium]